MQPISGSSESSILRQVEMWASPLWGMKESPIHETSWNHLQVGTRFLQDIAKWASKQHRTTIRTWRSWCQSCIRILEGFETKPSVQNDAKCKRACLSRQFKFICAELHLHTCLAFFLARNSWTPPTWYSNCYCKSCPFKRVFRSICIWEGRRHET